MFFRTCTIFRLAKKVRFYGTRFTGGKESICSEAVRNVGASNELQVNVPRTMGILRDGHNGRNQKEVGVYTVNYFTYFR